MNMTPSPAHAAGHQRLKEPRGGGKQKASQSLDAELEGPAVFLRTLSVEELG
jgi:hypothetical protein